MGVFTILSDLDSDSTVISNLFIDEYMLDASDCQIKVYLYLVRMMSAGRAASISDMAEQFGHPQKEILHALKFWEKSGLLSLQCDRAGRLVSIHLCEIKPRVIVRDPETDDAGRVVSIEPLLSDTQEKKPVERARLSKEAIEAFGKEEDNQALVYLAEKYIGKTLSVRELESLCYISDNLHFSFDLIDYLIQYCVGRGKRVQDHVLSGIRDPYGKCLLPDMDHTAHRFRTDILDIVGVYAAAVFDSVKERRSSARFLYLNKLIVISV